MFSPSLAASNDTCRIEAKPPEVGTLLLEEGAPKSGAEIPLIEQSGGTKKMRPRGGAPQSGGATSDAAGGAERRQPAVSSLTPAASSMEPSTSDDEGRAGAAVDAKVAAPTAAEPAKDPPLSAQDSDVDDAGSSSSTHEKRKESVGDARAGSRAPVVVKTNPKVIQAHATRFPAPKPRPPRQGPWASPIERPSSSRESVAELLAGTSDNPDYAEVPMTPSRLPVSQSFEPLVFCCLWLLHRGLLLLRLGDESVFFCFFTTL